MNYLFDKIFKIGNWDIIVNCYINMNVELHMKSCYNFKIQMSNFKKMVLVKNTSFHFLLRLTFQKTINEIKLEK